MVMPGISHRLVVPASVTASGESLSIGEYQFMYEIPTVAQLYFEVLQQTATVKQSLIHLVEAEPAETWQCLGSGRPDLRAVLSFPNYDFNVRYNNCKIVPTAADQSLRSLSMLLLHKNLFTSRKTAAALDIAVRDAWLTLADGGARFLETTELLARDGDYLSYIKVSDQNRSSFRHTS